MDEREFNRCGTVVCTTCGKRPVVTWNSALRCKPCLRLPVVEEERKSTEPPFQSEEDKRIIERLTSSNNARRLIEIAKEEEHQREVAILKAKIIATEDMTRRLSMDYEAKKVPPLDEEAIRKQVAKVDDLVKKVEPILKKQAKEKQNEEKFARLSQGGSATRLTKHCVKPDSKPSEILPSKSNKPKIIKILKKKPATIDA